MFINLMAAISNKELLLLLMIVLIVFIVLLTALGIVFVTVLRKRKPIVKVVMSPKDEENQLEETPQPQQEFVPVAEAEPVLEEEPVSEPEPEAEPEVVEEAAEDPTADVAEEIAEEPEVIEEVEEEPTAEIIEEEEPAAEVVEEPIEEETAPEVAEEPVAEPVEEEVAEEEPAVEPEEEEVQEPVSIDVLIANILNGESEEGEEQGAEEVSEEEEEETVVVRSVDESTGMALVVRYRKSFMARLIQSKDATKVYYTYIKNNILSYKKVKSRISWAHENFNSGRNNLVRFTMRGKTLCLYLALNPDDYAETKYKVERAESKKYEDIPCLYRIKNARRAKYALDLIAAVMEKFGIVYGEEQKENYYKPYETTEQLIEEGLIKELIKEENYNDFLQTHATVKVEEEPAPEAIEQPIDETVAEQSNEIVEEVIEEPAVVEEVVEEPAEEETVEVVDDTVEEQSEEVEEVAAETAEEPVEEIAEETAEEVEEESVEETTDEISEVVSLEALLSDIINGESEEVEEVEEQETEEPIEEEEEETVVVRSVDETTGIAIVVRYRKSFTAKLIQSKDQTKAFYTYLKNVLLSYKKVKNRISWAHENFNSGRNNLARFTMRGKTLCLYLALNPDDYAETKYKVERALSKKYEDIPCMYRIKNARRAKYAVDLIAAVMEKYGIVYGVEQKENYYKPYETTEQLIEEGLIKELIKEENYDELIQRHTIAAVVREVREETTTEIVEEPTAAEEVVEEPVTEVVEEIVEEPATEVVEEIVEEPTTEIVEEVVEEPETEIVEEIAEEAIEEAVEETEAEQSDEAIEEVAAEIEEETTQEAAVEVEEEPETEEEETEAKEEPIEEPIEETTEEPVEETVEEVAEEIVVEETIAEQSNEVVEETIAEQSNEVAEPEVVEEVDPEKVEIIEQSKKEVAKKRREKVTATEVNNIINDEVAVSLVKKKRTAAVKPEGPRATVNIDTLNAHFEAGERVNLEALKAKKLVAKNTAAVKVLARGTLTKPLTVEASAFSIEAVKMIILTGGTVIKG